eukprot:3697211-Alexandrium_andersonii.AAC.1
MAQTDERPRAEQEDPLPRAGAGERGRGRDDGAHAGSHGPSELRSQPLEAARRPAPRRRPNGDRQRRTGGQGGRRARMQQGRAGGAAEQGD